MNQFPNVYASSLEKLLSFETKKINIVIVPQIQLMPFALAAVIEHKKNIGPTLFVGPTASEQWRGILGAIEGLVPLSIRTLDADSESFWEKLLADLTERDVQLDAVYLHSFAQGPNAALALALERTKIKTRHIYIYSDGSRNNMTKEFKENKIEHNIINIADSIDCPQTILNFGFKSNTSFKHPTEVVSYADVERMWSLSTYESNEIIMSPPGGVDSSVRVIMMRYFGRDPYYLKARSKPANIIHDLVSSLPTRPSFELFRVDNRFDQEIQINKWTSVNDKTACSILKTRSDAFTQKSGEYLFEQSILSSPEVAKTWKEIYTFDSSFPLILQSVKMQKALDRELVYWVGGDDSILRKHFKTTGVRTYARRVSTLINDTLSLGLFKIEKVDDSGNMLPIINPVTLSAPSSLFRLQLK